MKITANDAFALSESFRHLSVVIGDYRFSNWNDLSPNQRKTLEDNEWTLLTNSSDMITAAVGIIIDDAQYSVSRLIKATKDAETVVKNINAAQNVLEVAAGAIVLGGAVISENPAAIGSALSDLAATVNKLLNPTS
jgi:hypothetical protein